MQSLAVRALAGRNLRFNPAYRLVAIDRLTPSERRDLGEVRADGELTAVLLPNAPGLSVKGVCREIARLLEALRVPARISEVSRSAVEDQGSLVIRLVLDSVLEVEDEGRFVTGATASALCESELDVAATESGPSQVSRDALHYAEALDLDDALALSARLYFFNRLPVTPQWSQRIPSAAALTRWLGLEDRSPLRETLDRAWVESPPPPDNAGWRIFRLPGGARTAPFKLYVNVHPEFLRETLAEAVPLFELHGLRSFKFGRELGNLLRPDKLVAYAQAREQVAACADALLVRLAGMTPHIVPFTAVIDQEGLLSWGIDPPRAEQVSMWQGTSWRRWLTDRLAVALISARAAGAPSPSRFALQRIALEGVAVDSWTPCELARGEWWEA